MRYSLLISLYCCLNSLWGQLYYDAPNASAYNPFNNKYFITNQGSGEVFQIDRSGNKWLFAKGLQSPRNIAFYKLPMGWTVLVLDSNRMVIYDTAGTLLGYETVAGIGQIQDCVYDSIDRVLYTTDRRRGVIYKTTFLNTSPYSPSTRVWVKGLVKPSALVLQKSKGRLLLVQDTTNSGLIAVSLKDSSAQLLRYLNLSNVMGLAEDDQGNLYFSALAEQYIYQLNKYYKGSPKALIREPKPGDLTIVGNRNEWVYTCILCGKVYVAALHIFGPSSEAIACAGDSIDTYKNPFLKNIGTFELGNEFVLELSDYQGDFSKGYELNRVSDTLIPFSISGVFPSQIPSGLGYRIRWSSTKPKVNGYPQMAEVSKAPQLTLSEGSDTLYDCGGKGMRLMAMDSVALVDFKWSINGGKTLDSSLFFSIKGDRTVVKKVWVEATLAESGCRSKDSVCLVFGELPSIENWSSSVGVCQGDSATLGARSSSSTLGFTYSWHSDRDSTLTFHIAQPRVFAFWKDSFWVVVKNPSGCSSNYSQQLEITTYDSIRWLNKTDTFLEVVSSKGGAITWFKNGLRTNDTGSRWSKPDTGIYWACTQWDVGCWYCTDSFRVRPRATLGFKVVNNRFGVQMHPNPCKSKLFLDESERTTWEIFSLDGRRLMCGSGNEIDVAYLTAGLYWIAVPGRTETPFVVGD